MVGMAAAGCFVNYCFHKLPIILTKVVLTQLPGNMKRRQGLIKIRYYWPFLKLVGEVPVQFLKNELKLAGSEKPRL